MHSSRSLGLSEVIRDGRWLAHRYDEANDTIRFRLVPREEHRRLIFLTEAELGDGPMQIFPRGDCFAEARQLELPTPRFIFHSAYCCSTLLARAFDVPGTSMGFREPQILNDISGLQLRRADPRQIAAAVDAALLLLARPLGTDETNVIKPSNVFNPSIPVTLAMRPDARAVLLYAPLESFLGSIARKEIEGRTWVRELMWKLIQLGQADSFGFTSEELYRQTDLQVAALAWLAQQAQFREIAAAHGDRVRTLDSESLLTKPRDAMAALSGLFGLDLDAGAIASGPAFSRHSKWGDDYHAADRQREREAGLDLHAREIEIVLKWARKVAEHAGVELAPPAPLLPES